MPWARASGSGRSKTHAKMAQKIEKDGSRPLTGASRTDKVTNDEVSAAPGVPAHSQQRHVDRRRPLRLSPGSSRGRGSSPARFFDEPLERGGNAWEPDSRIGPSTSRRIGGDVSTVQEKKRKYRHQQ